MRKKRIDGNDFYDLFRSGLDNLRAHESEVNAMNVFPVPDGDTGYNMRMTLENGLKSAKRTDHAGKYLGELALGMLLGARGNSGVILSQIVNGLASELKNDSIVDAYELYQGFSEACKYAYRAVVKPEEGTILTVIREGVRHVKEAVSRGTYVDIFFKIYLTDLRTSLRSTPELLPVLKEAGVVDSGALGYVYLVEGMLKCLQDGPSAVTVPEADALPGPSVRESDGTYGYCTEVVLKRDPSVPYTREKFTDELTARGGSVVVAEIGLNVKVHVHTGVPGDVLNLCQSYGTIQSVKIEDMDAQVDGLKEEGGDAPEPAAQDIVKIAVTDGEGTERIYREIGCDVLIPGGPTVTVPTSAILDAVYSRPAGAYFVLTNNKNNIPAANLAVQVLGDRPVYVVPTENLLEGYFVLGCDDPTSSNPDYRKSLLLDNYRAITTVELFRASRDSSVGGVEIRKDGFASRCKGRLLSSADTLEEALCAGLRALDGLDSFSACVILKGRDFDVPEEEIRARIESVSEGLSVSFLDGGQSVYAAILGVF